MTTKEIIKLIEQIVHPYFIFEMDDFYGDRGGLPYPMIEELDVLCFKKNGKDKKLAITKDAEQTMIDKIKDLNIGSVELIQIPSFGVYICVKLPSYNDNELFVIKNDDGICSMYIDLDKAKNELISIYKKTPDYKHYGYQINVYILRDNEYITTNTIYTYNEGVFYKNVI
jgi:hypothetical protein